MFCRAGIALCVALFSLSLGGCNKNPFVVPPSSTAWTQPGQALGPQVAQSDRRVDALDADNRNLHAELAKAQQEKQLLQDELSLVRKRLNETANQLREAQVASQDAEKKVQAIQASTRRRGGASITANNSVEQSLQVAEIPGFEVRQDGDVVRVEIPTDRLFHPQSAQLLPSANYLIDQLAGAISRYYPSQMMGVEGYTDSAPAGGTSNHQLSVSQAMVVFSALTQRNRIPSQQLFVVGHGANHPRASNATPAGRTKNRRIELVVYPEKKSEG